MGSLVTDFEKLLEALAGANARFVVIGGVALVLHGSGRVTRDLDICYSRARGDIEALVRGLAPLHPRLRGAPEALPFVWDERTIRSGLNFTLTTDAGDIDILGEVPGLGSFERVAESTRSLDVFGRAILVLDLDALEASKRAAGRVKDLLDLAEIAEIRKRSGG